LTRDVAVDAADGFDLGTAFADTTFEIGASAGVGSEPDDRDAPERRVELAVAASIEPMTCCLAAADCYRVRTAREANARSLPNRCGLSPTPTRMVDAVSGHTPLRPTSSGATALVIRRRRTFVRASCSSSSWMRWASSRIASLVTAARLSSSTLTRNARVGLDQFGRLERA
jgi:hypothetical protein